MRTIIGVRRYLGCREWLIGATLALTVGCGRATEPAEELGVAQIAIMQAPGDTRCVRVTVTGSRTVSQAVDVTPGQATQFALTGLPLGSDSFSAAAFSVACAQLTPSAVAAWVGDPVIASVTVNPPVNVTLILHRNGRASVGVDFQDDPDGGTPATGGTSGAGGVSGTGGVSGSGGMAAGGPITFAPALTAPLPSPIVQMVSADFNADGLADLAWISNNGAVFLSLSTAAVGTAPRQVAQVSGAIALAALDLDGDGLADLIIAIAGGSPVLLTQIAPGAFAAPVSMPAPPLTTLAVGDATGDGIPDLVGATNTGTGFLVTTMAPARPIFTAPFPLTAIALVDLNRDPLLDIAAIGSASAVVTFLQIAPSLFSPALVTALPATANALAGGDLNGDGFGDLGVATGGGVLVLRGDSRGGFGVSSLFPAPATGLLAADFNGDGRLDLATLAGPFVLVSRNLVTGFDAPVSFPTGPVVGSSLIAVSAGPGSRPSLVVGSPMPLITLLRNTSP